MAPRTQIVAVAVVALLVASTTQAAVTCHSGEPSTGAASDGCEITIGSAPSVFQLGAGTSSVHRFTLVNPSGGAASISFVRQSGRPRLFLSNDGRPASATHFSAASPEDATSNAVVPALCAAGESQCTLDVAVVGDEASASTYTVQATLPDTTTELETGIASIGTVSAGAYTYFSWQSPAGSEGKAISFTVTAYAGDPDLFVSTAPNPTRTNSYWSSVQYSNDQVEIGTTNEPHRCTAPCEYYIGVYGAGSVDSRFSVLAYYMDQTATLNDGQPQRMWVVAHGSLHYKFTTPADFGSLEITCMPSYGDPDLYVDVATQNLDHSGQHSYSSNAQNGEDRVVIYPTDYQFYSKCNIGEPCDIYINVYGYESASFTLIAATDGATRTILDGVAYLDAVPAKEYAYYSMTVLKASTPVTFTLSPQVGDPDMYVSCTVTHPNSGAGEYTWSSIRVGVDQVVISGSDACTTPATYYVGVKSFGNHNSTYTILGWVAHDGHPIELQQGFRQDAVTAANSMTYFQLTHNGFNEDIEFILDVRVGNVIGYVNNVIDPTTGQVILPTVSSCTEASCTVQNAKWSTLSSPGGNSVTIPIFSQDNCNNCVFVMGVYAHNVEAEYSITAVTSSGVMTLSSGWPVRREVTMGEYDYYRSWVWSGTQDLTFTLTSFYGDADLYVSETNVLPSSTNFKWSAASGWRDDTLVIQASQVTSCAPDNQRGVECELFLAVKGFTNASYSLTLEYSTSDPVALSAGVPHQSFVNTSKYEYYKIFPPSPASTVYITVTPAYGDPDLYVSVDGTRAGRTHYDYASTALHGAETVTIPASACSGCEISVAVWGYRASAYTIQYSLPQTVVQLQEGQPSTGHAEPYTMSYFSFYNPTHNDITIALTSLYGDPDMYVGFANPNDPYDLPTWGDFDWASVVVGSDVVYIPHTDNDYCQYCTYIVGVYGFSNSSFTITATTEATSIVQLVDGLPQLSAGNLHQYRYFSFRDHLPMENVTFRVTPITGDASVFVTNTYVPGDGKTQEQGQLPTSKNYLWSSWDDYRSQWGTVTITPNSPHWHNTVTGIPYTIGVLCSDQTVFQITAMTSDTTEVLRVGVPSSIHNVAQGENQRFKFYMPTTTQDITVAMTVFSGGPTVMMSTTHTDPYCQLVGNHHAKCYNYTWYMPVSTDVLTVDHSAPCKSLHNCNPAEFKVGFFYVNVFGNVNSMYSLTVLTPSQSVQLTEGVPVTVFTTLRTVCVRSAQTDACTGDPASWKSMQGMNFAFSVTKDELGHLPAVQFSVTRACQENGCSDTLTIYAILCSEGACIESDRFPSPDNNRYSQVVNNNYNTLDLSSTVVESCAIGNNPCSVFVSVYKDCVGVQCEADLFRAAYSTQNGMEILPSTCTEGHLCNTPVGLVSGGSTKFYAAYLNPSTTTDLVVQLESCSGSVQAFLCHDASKCDDVFRPTAASHEYSVASNSWANFGATTGAWFISVIGAGANTTTNMFEINIAHSSSVVELKTGAVSATASGDTIDVSWSAPTADVALTSGAMTYNVYAIPTASVSKFSTASPCGIALAAFSAGVTDSVGYASTSATSYTITGLLPYTAYTVNVVANCGPNCAQGSSVAGKQKAAYAAAVVTTGKATPTHHTPSGGGLSPGAIVGIIFLVLAFVGGIGFAVYWKKFRTPSSGDGYVPNQYNAL